MDAALKDIELIDNYLQGNLSEPERLAVEARLQKDEAFRENFLQQQEVVKAIVFAEASALKQQLRTRDVAMPLVPQQKSRNWYMAIAASLALLALLSYLFMNKQPDTDSLYTAYYSPYPNVEAPLNRAGEEKLNGFQLYELERYEEALPILAQDPSPAGVFYTAQSYLALGHSAEALLLLEELVQVSSPYQEAAKWYAALAALQQQHMELAQKYLQQLVEEEGAYAKEARQLLSEI